MKTLYSKDEGVSPVIATILMVAITVVLAATVYLMVSGYMISLSPPLVASLTQTNVNEVGTTWYYNITLSMSTPATAAPGNVHFAVNGTPGTAGFAGAGKTDGITFTTVDTGTINIYWNNVMGTRTVQGGDYFTIISTAGFSLNGATVSMSVPSGATGSISVTLIA